MRYKVNFYRNVLFHRVTKKTIIKKLRQLGLKEGDSLCVHSSLSSLGYVVGGAESVIQALLEVIGGPEKERQTENIRFANKAGEGSHVGAINVDSSSACLLEACFLLAQ